MRVESVDAVVFDLGGVLIDWDPRHLYRRLIPDEEEMERFLAEVCTQAWNEGQDRGRPFAEAVAELSERHPEHAELIAAYFERWGEMLAGPIEDTVAILKELRAAGDVDLYALTNWSMETFPLALERYDFLGWFVGRIVSGEEDMAKPDPEIFDLMAERFGVDPARTVFIDDSGRNVAAARDAGFEAIRYEDPQQLRAALVRRGLL